MGTYRFEVIFITILVSSCAGISHVISPVDIDKESLKKLPSFYTIELGLEVAIAPSVDTKMSTVADELEKQFNDFIQCIYKNNLVPDNFAINQIYNYKIVVVEGTFQCEYHGGRCNGEVDTTNKLLILSYKAFNRKGIMPLFKHELLHVYKLIKNDDSDLKAFLVCSRY